MAAPVRLLAGLLLFLLAGCATPLGDAAGRGDLKAMSALLEQGQDVNEKDACGMSGGETALFCAVWSGNQPVVKFLLERGADVNAKTNWNMTPLDAAVGRGDVQMVQFLLERGAETNNAQVQVCDSGGFDINMCTSLQYAKHTGNTKIARLLEYAEEKELAKLGVPSSSAPLTAAPPAGTVVPASDVDRVPSATARAKTHAYAIVVGIEQYQQKLPRADFAAHDAEVMSQYLSKVLGYQEENVVVLLNDRATKTGIEKYIEAWLPDHVEKDDSVFIYYSGHGAPNAKTGKAYLVPYDGDPAFVEKTSYPLDRLYEQLANLPAKEVVVILDSCFSGAGGRSVIAKGMRPMVLSVENPLLAKGNTVVLAAGSGDQVSSTYDQKGHGLLTYFFLKGLQGEGDRNKDQSIELKELFEYLKPQVERVARREFHNEQSPQLLGSPDMLKRGVRLLERNEVPSR